MSKFGKLTKIATGVSAALLMGYGVSAKADITAFKPSAYAESILNVTNFNITLAGGGSLLPLLGTAIKGLTANVQGSVSANLNGGSDADAVAIDARSTPPPSFNISASVGPGYVPFTSYGLGTLAATTFAGGTSTHVGNAILENGAPPTDARTQAQVNINGSSSIGFADSRQNLATTFDLVILAPLVFDVSFFASSYARIALGQADVIAQIDRNWGLTVKNTSDPLNNILLLGWDPDGTVGNLAGACVVAVACVELADSFNLNLQGATQNTGDFVQTNGPAPFAVRVALLAGSYQLAINHDVSADATAIPEPGSLALLGAGLLALPALRRRKSKKA